MAIKRQRRRRTTPVEDIDGPRGRPHRMTPAERDAAAKEAYLEFFQSKSGMAHHYLACVAVGVSRSTVGRWIKTDADFARRIEEAEDNVVDQISATYLRSTLKADDRRCLQWWLNKKGRRQGFGDSQEINLGISGSVLMKHAREEASISTLEEAIRLIATRAGGGEKE